MLLVTLYVAQGGGMGIPDANFILNMVMLVVVVFGAPRFFKSKLAEEQLKAKDAVIATNEQTIESLHERVATVEADLKGCSERAERYHDRAKLAEEKAVAAEAKYQEQTRYTAPEAFKEINAHLAKIEELLRSWLVRDAAQGLDTHDTTD